MNRRAFLKSLGATTGGALVAPCLWAAEEEKERAQDLLSGTKARIEQHRKANGKITLKSRDGKPLSGVEVQLEQLRHDFLFGCNFFMFDRCGDPEAEQQYRQQFVDLFNFCTLGFYWAAYEREQGSPNYPYTDRVLDWTSERELICKGHPLVWDHPASSPKWLPSDSDAIERLSKQRVSDIVSRYRGRINLWDVVNEATHLPDKWNKTQMANWALEYGPVRYVAEHLKVARETNPSATLLVNDYRTDPPYLKLLTEVRDQDNSLFHVVGIQSHMHDGAWPPQKTWDVCERYAGLGLPLHFTETTLVSGPRTGPGENWGATTPELEEKQAESTVQFYSLLFSHPSVRAITWWDFSDRGAWQRAAAGWLRRDMSPKPVYQRMKEQIKQIWWTNEKTVTDDQGTASLRAFLGKHRATVRLSNGHVAKTVVHWKRGSENDFELSV